MRTKLPHPTHTGSTTLLHPQGTTISDHTDSTQIRQSCDTKNTTQTIQINTRMHENDEGMNGISVLYYY